MNGTISKLAIRWNRLRALPAAERRQQWAHYLHTVWCFLVRQDKNCPYCGNRATERWGKDALILEVRHCPQCRLRFTWPKSSSRFNQIFYNWLYHEIGTTDLPAADKIEQMKRDVFRGTAMDFTGQVALVQTIQPDGRLVDFGASWGYATWQFGRAGFIATGYEPSQPRVAYGRKHLEVDLRDRPEQLRDLYGQCDVVFSSHVFEHLPDPRSALDLASSLLKPGGRLVIQVPNCDGRNARTHGLAWGPLYGSKHVLSLDRHFFAYALPRHGFRDPLFFSEPYDHAAVRERILTSRGFDDTTGDELLVVAMKCAS